MEDNLKILEKLIVGTILFVIILIVAYYTILILAASRIPTDGDYKFTDEMILDLKYIAGVSRSKTFKPIAINPKAVYEDEEYKIYDVYELVFEISKEDYDNNNLSYGVNGNYETLNMGTKVEEKDNNTYTCYKKCNSISDKIKFEKLRNIYNEINNLETVYSASDELTNSENEGTSFTDPIEPRETNAVYVDSPHDKFIDEYNEAASNLDPIFFATDFENYKSKDTDMYLSKREVSGIAEKGFEESAARIAEEGADNKESETIKKEEIVPNNYFTRKYYEGDDGYPNLKMEAFVVTRTNEMGNGVKIYIDPTTGLNVGGQAFGD